MGDQPQRAGAVVPVRRARLREEDVERSTHHRAGPYRADRDGADTAGQQRLGDRGRERVHRAQLGIEGLLRVDKGRVDRLAKRPRHRTAGQRHPTPARPVLGKRRAPGAGRLARGRRQNLERGKSRRALIDEHSGRVEPRHQPWVVDAHDCSLPRPRPRPHSRYGRKACRLRGRLGHGSARSAAEVAQDHRRPVRNHAVHAEPDDKIEVRLRIDRPHIDASTPLVRPGHHVGPRPAVRSRPARAGPPRTADDRRVRPAAPTRTGRPSPTPAPSVVPVAPRAAKTT